jgi:hypothetical protein
MVSFPASLKSINFYVGVTTSYNNFNQSFLISVSQHFVKTMFHESAGRKIKKNAKYIGYYILYFPLLLFANSKGGLEVAPPEKI